MSLGYKETAESQEVTSEMQAEMLADLLDALKIKVVDIVANDTGVQVAPLFAAHHTTRVRTLLLSNCDVDTNSPPPSFTPLQSAAQQGVLADGFAGLLANKEAPRSIHLQKISLTRRLSITSRRSSALLYERSSSAALQHLSPIIRWLRLSPP